MNIDDCTHSRECSISKQQNHVQCGARLQTNWHSRCNRGCKFLCALFLDAFGYKPLLVHHSSFTKLNLI